MSSIPATIGCVIGDLDEAARPFGEVPTLALAWRINGDRFDLRPFHDFVWKNGSEPLSLQRWQLLGLRDDLDRVDRLGTSSRAVRD